jgi:hypothetical protein
MTVARERCIAPIQREPLDASEWRQGLCDDLPLEASHTKAAALSHRHSRSPH